MQDEIAESRVHGIKSLKLKGAEIEGLILIGLLQIV